MCYLDWLIDCPDLCHWWSILLQSTLLTAVFGSITEAPATYKLSLGPCSVVRVAEQQVFQCLWFVNPLNLQPFELFNWVPQFGIWYKYKLLVIFNKLLNLKLNFLVSVMCQASFMSLNDLPCISRSTSWYLERRWSGWWFHLCMPILSLQKTRYLLH